MITIDHLRIQLKAIYKIDTKITFDLPEYEIFLSDLKEFIYQNHFENTDEWIVISKNLIYKSTEALIRKEADTIMVELEKLHRRMLLQKNEEFWLYIHPMIIQVVQQKMIDGHYADSIESAFKEINSRLKKIYSKHRSEEKDGADLMRQMFSPTNKPLLIFEDIKSKSGENVQNGFMQIFAGAMIGIRNPKAHENQTVSKDSAIKSLVFASLLMDKIDEAISYSKISE